METGSIVVALRNNINILGPNKIIKNVFMGMENGIVPSEVDDP